MLALIAAAARRRLGAGARRWTASWPPPRGPCEQVDVAFGKAGLLLGACLLLEALPAGPGRSAAARRSGTALRDSLWAELEPQPPLAEGPELRSLGAAHGWAGYLFALLRWSEVVGDAAPGRASQARLEELGALARPLGRGLRWPYDARAADAPQTGLEASWCNGAAGYVSLWATAQRLLGDERFGEWARMAAWTACESPVPSGGDLCCGLGGRAYALLASTATAAKRSGWRAPACSRSGPPPRSAPTPLRRDSLYKGEVGVALLAAELERPEHACMPLFDSEVRGRPNG